MADRRPAKRASLFTCVFLQMVLTAGSSDASGQAITDLGAAFIAKAGRSLNNVTLVHTWVQGWWTQAVAATSPIWVSYTLSIIRANQGMDAGDFADVQGHGNDVVLYDCRALLESEATDDVLFPRTEYKAGSGVFVESRGQRKIERVGDTIWLVGEKTQITEQAVVFRGSVTMLWKLP